jgi:hypothetical protein
VLPPFSPLEPRLPVVAAKGRSFSVVFAELCFQTSIIISGSKLAKKGMFPAGGPTSQLAADLNKGLDSSFLPVCPTSTATSTAEFIIMNEAEQIRVCEDSAEGLDKVLCGMYVHLNYVISRTYFPNVIHLSLKLS